ncbi:MAG: 16S rRNA (adenine(1518)-N(6)/adenine(1519)-N(6))-dimethyltransferase RsmA [Thermoplasmata archaeon]|nr:16S rRNA (adenine(1518)-N(6)/adenine(1519)-N(6))-dimethyltransferase RsmA [Thermoplasmata archaeon]
MPRTSTDSSSRPDRGKVRRGPSHVPGNAAEVAAALEGLELTPSRSRGQTFLTDPFVADAEAALVGTVPGEAVLEVGGGLGLLTQALLRRGLGPVTVIEREPRLAAFLRYHFEDRVHVVEGDALTEPVPEVGAAVGNLPFAIATPLLLRWFQGTVPRVVALVQKEVGERLAAGPGSRVYGRLSILAALYGVVECHQTVPASAFYPVPRVDGRLVVFERRRGELPVRSLPTLESLLDTLFAGRRKQLGNLLPHALLHVHEGRPASEVARRAEWPTEWERLRPESLAPEAYFRLVSALEDLP